MIWLMVHIPKTAGTSFRKSMRKIFGSSMILDYDDKPLKVDRWKRNLRTWLQGRKSAELAMAEQTCIFGHYMPLKYSALSRRADCRMVTWLRDPIERMVSNYWFIFEHHRIHKLQPGQSFVVDENWTIEQFLFSPRYRNYACQFLWGVPLKRFDFVGIVEYYEEDLMEFGQSYFGQNLAAYQENRSHVTTACEWLSDATQRRKAEGYHARDMALYRQALEMRAKRRAKVPNLNFGKNARAAA